jgi:hypothetical protein
MGLFGMAAGRREAAQKFAQCSYFSVGDSRRHRYVFAIR